MKKDYFLVKPDKKFDLNEYKPNATPGYKNKEEALEKLEKDIKKMYELQEKLYAQNRYSLLIILQAMDAAGKDGIIKHVLSGLNPQGCQVYSFKQPSAEELDHDYFWRIYKCLPERGRIGIFNRSYYEEVLITKVHPEYILKQNLPDISSIEDIDKNFWKKRYEQINNMEKIWTENGIVILKFFLNLSKEEQKQRFLERIENPNKRWKFSYSDIKERKYWEKYQEAYEDMFKYTSTKWAPWYIIPADKKWYTRVIVGDIIVKTLEDLNLEFPKLTEEKEKELLKAKEELLNEK